MSGGRNRGKGERSSCIDHGRDEAPLRHDPPVNVESVPIKLGALRVDRLMLVSLLGVGGFWVLLLMPPWGSEDVKDMVFFLVVATYVVTGSMAMAVLYARQNITAKQEVLTLLALWLVAVALWTGIFLRLGVIAEHDPDTGYLVNGVSWSSSTFFALLIATPCFFVWQVPALIIRAIWRRLPARPRRDATGVTSAR
jgi:hypothetical protein